MDLGWQELLIILVIVIVVFGAGKLPETARSLGQGVREFRKATGSMDAVAASGTGSGVVTSGGTAAGSHAKPVRPEDI